MVMYTVINLYEYTYDSCYIIITMTATIITFLNNYKYVCDTVYFTEHFRE